MQLIGQLGSIVNALAIVGIAALLIWFGLRPATRALLEAKGSEPAAIENLVQPQFAMAEVPAEGTGGAAGLAGAGGAGSAEEQPNLIADLTEKLGRTPLKRLEQLIDYDEEQAADILKQWMRGSKRHDCGAYRQLLARVRRRRRPGGTPARVGNAASEANRAAMIEEAHAQGFESGKAAAEASIAGRLEEREEHFRNELAAARDAWAQQESGQIAERLVKGLEEIEARLAETTARILRPFLGAELQRRAIDDLVESLSVLRAQEQDATINVFGAGDLLEALRVQLEGRFGNVAYQPGEPSDVRVTFGQTVLETRIGAWMARIEEATR